jgi:hypothetical protein
MIVNYILENFTRNVSPKEDIVFTSNYFNDVTLDFSLERFSNFRYTQTPIFFNKETGILCGVLGYFTNLDDIKKRFSIGKK